MAAGGARGKAFAALEEIRLASSCDGDVPGMSGRMPQEPLLFGYHLFRLKTNAQLRKVPSSNLNSVC